MAKRRGNREGTIYKRPNGTWSAQVSVDGERLSKYGRTRQECQLWLRETLGKVDQGLTVESTRSPLGPYLNKWLEISSQSLRPKTVEQYRQIISTHIVPAIGDVRLSTLRPDHIQALYSQLLSAGVGPRTIQLIHAILHKSLVQGMRWGLLTHNAAAAVQKPKIQRREMRVLSREQAVAFLDAAQDSRYFALLHLAITTGLRQGELLGLQWGDLDRDGQRLQIQRQIQRITGQGLIFTEPKTASGRRAIALSVADLEILRAHRKRQLEERLFMGDKWADQGLIFPSTVGTPTEPRNIIREFKRILTHAHLPDIRFHDLRHTAATLMLQTGVHPKVVQERLGHSDIKTTLNTYSHVLPSLQQDAAEKLAALLS